LEWEHGREPNGGAKNPRPTTPTLTVNRLAFPPVPIAGDAHSSGELVDLFTGLVVESLAVTQDFGGTTVPCRRCDATRSDGDRVTVALSCYEDHSREIAGVYCSRHGVEGVAESMGVRAERQAVVAAVLESSGYLPPTGRHQPDGLTLGEVTVVDESPTDAGY
jgi:hypothetical protein